MAVLLLVIGLVLFVGLVVIHEFGHFIMAKRAGVEIEEFGIGFPPRVYKHKTRGGWLFTINLLPLGGFVKLKGEHDSDTAEGTFGAASLRDKSLIMAAGVVMNLITAFVLLTLLALFGIPKLVDNQFTVAGDTKIVSSEIIIGATEPHSPASDAKRYDGAVREKSPILARDHIKRISVLLSNGSIDRRSSYTVADSKDLSRITRTLAGKPVVIDVSRSGTQRQFYTVLRTEKVVNASYATPDQKGFLGVYPTDYTLQRSTWSAPIVAGGLIRQFTVLTFQGLGKAVAGLGKLIAGAVTGNSTARSNGQKDASEQVSGPVGIFVILKDGSSLGWQFVIMIIAVISLTLAIMNILPIPALDGGRLWLTLATRGIGKPISQEREELINAIGFLTLLVLILLITVVDVKRFF